MTAALLISLHVEAELIRDETRDPGLRLVSGDDVRTVSWRGGCRVQEITTVIRATILYCTVLYCTVLHCTALYCTVLHCTVLARFHRDGFLVLRRVLAPATIATLNSASADLRTNKTLHCQMAYYNGPPIFHKVCDPNLLCGPLKWHLFCVACHPRSPKVIMLILHRH